MSSLLRISEAASLALHTAALLAAGDGSRMSVREIADRLGASQAHLAKVLQRLAHAGIVTSLRGPQGGFTLARKPESISLREVFEAIEGPPAAGTCLMGDPVCGAKHCLLGGLVSDVNQQVGTYLTKTSVAKVKDIYGDPHAKSKKHSQYR
jgi:Rrf2 family protein